MTEERKKAFELLKEQARNGELAKAMESLTNDDIEAWAKEFMARTKEQEGTWRTREPML